MIHSVAKNTTADDTDNQSNNHDINPFAFNGLVSPFIFPLYLNAMNKIHYKEDSDRKN